MPGYCKGLYWTGFVPRETSD